MTDRNAGGRNGRANHLLDLLTSRRKPSLEVAVAIERATDGAVPVLAWVPVETPE